MNLAKKIRRLLLPVLLTAQVWAGTVIESLEVNGTRYESVKFGPINQDEVVMFHSHGVTTVPVARLPAEVQTALGVKPSEAVAFVTPPAATPPSTPDAAAILEAMRAKRPEPSTSTGNANSDWAIYNRDRLTKVVLDGKLVDRQTLKPLVGYLAAEHASLSDGARTFHGVSLDLAERRETVEKTASAMELRPALWHRTAEQVFLINYTPATLPGALMKVYVAEIATLDGVRTFKVGVEPSFEQWKRLTGR